MKLKSGKTSTEYSIVIPVFNSHKTLLELCNRLQKVMDSLKKPYEIILVDDASRDDSWAVLESLYKQYNAVKIIQLMRNVGQFRAIMCGLNHACGKYIITMDDDLQNPPEEIPKLIKIILENDGIDCVIGVPQEKKHGLIRRLGSSILNIINSYIFKKPIDLRMSSFRIIRRSIIIELIKNTSVNVTPGPLLLLTTRNIINITVHHDKRKYGTTNYGIFRIIKTLLDNILNYTTLPLYFVGIFGIMVSLLSFCFATYIVIRRLLFGFSIIGWASLITMISFFSGLILFSLGIIGEYLIRIIRQLSTESQYIIRSIKE
jgi:polyisoprenyl-phosphate glycosyltransferase